MMNPPRAQRGLSLVELLVAMALGLVVVGAILVNFIGTGASSARQNAMAQMSEDAQLAFSLLSRDLQMAGYTQPKGVTTAGTDIVFDRKYTGRAVFACTRPMVSESAALVAGGGGDGVDCQAGGSTATHALVVNYEADAANAVVNGAGNPTDCLGNVASTVTAGPITYRLVSDRFYVATNANTGRPELRCAGPGSPGQPLIENVESMRLWMGEGDAGNLRRPVHYIAPDAVTDWGRVVAVRICLLMRSSDPILANEDNATYSDCSGADATSADRRIRRAFFSTVALRNKTAF